MSDSDDSDSSDDDDTNKGGGRGRKQRGLFREVNPPPEGYDSDSLDPDSDSNLLREGCPFKIYPGPDLEQCRYRHAHLRDFSQKAIKQYNHQTVRNMCSISFVSCCLLGFLIFVQINNN